ncbi:MAG: RNA methyltransferase [Bacillota bacterium]
MPFSRVSSPANPLLKEYRRLLNSTRCRRSAGKLPLEGPHLIREALAAGMVPETFFFTPSFKEGKDKDLLSSLPDGARLVEIPEPLFNRLMETDSPQGAAAVFPFQEPELHALPEGEGRLVLLLERLQDPGNMGTLLRTAAAAGVDAVFFTLDCADPFSPKVLRSTAGAVFHLNPAVTVDPLQLTADLKSKGFQVLAAVPRSGLLYWAVDYKRSSLLIIGSEGAGISRELAAQADSVVSIPQAGRIESLNAAVAASIILFEAVRQRSVQS